MLNKPVIMGKCNQMCPESEIRMREKEKLLHPMEILQGTRSKPIADKNKVVKEFGRSSAGQDMQKVSALRPCNVLLDTITYLLAEAINNEDFPWRMRYDFIFDRLRAVRQDMIIQDIPQPQAITLLQPIVRFYAFASYRMCHEKPCHYVPRINNKHFQECLNRLLTMYDDCEEFSQRTKKNINYSPLFEDSRPLIEAIYILFNMGIEEAMHRGLALAPRWKNTTEVRGALKVSLLYRRNNFFALCREIKKLPHLLAAVAVMHLPVIRRVCIGIMSVAYSSKDVRVPIGELQKLLCYDNVEDLVQDLTRCDMKYEVRDGQAQGDAIFTKGMFNDNAILGVRKVSFVEDKLRGHSVQELVLFGPD